jgi:hypothetical protein
VSAYRSPFHHWPELDSHDILIADNLPAESYLAMANRGAFEEPRGLLPAMVEGGRRPHADFCGPVITEGPTLDFVRRRLAARAEEIGWEPGCAVDGVIAVAAKSLSLRTSLAERAFDRRARCDILWAWMCL